MSLPLFVLFFICCLTNCKGWSLWSLLGGSPRCRWRVKYVAPSIHHRRKQSNLPLTSLGHWSQHSPFSLTMSDLYSCLHKGNTLDVCLLTMLHGVASLGLKENPDREEGKSPPPHLPFFPLHSLSLPSLSHTDVCSAPPTACWQINVVPHSKEQHKRWRNTLLSVN